MAEEEAESTPPLAFTSVILRDFEGFTLEKNLLGLREEKRGGFGFENFGGELREHRRADKAPPGAWPSTSIFAPSIPWVAHSAAHTRSL